MAGLQGLLKSFIFFKILYFFIFLFFKEKNNKVKRNYEIDESLFARHLDQNIIFEITCNAKYIKSQSKKRENY